MLAAAQMGGGGLPPGMMMGNGQGEDEVETHNAEELTDETFEERLLEYELLLVFFRKKDDHQMKQADKEVELAATELAVEEGALAIALADTESCPLAMKKAKISKGPTITVFRRGTPLSLGPNSLEARAIVNFMRYLAAPVSKKLEGSAAVSQWLREADSSTVVLGIFADATRPSHNVWIKSAEALRPPYRFAEASVEDVAATKLFADANLDPAKNQYAVVLPHKWVGKDEAPYHLGSDFRQMKEFVPEHAFTRVGPLNGATRKKWIAEKKSIVGLSLDMAKMGRMFKYVLNRLHKLILAWPELNKQFAFTIHDTKYIANAASEFGVDTSRDFVASVHNFSSQAYYGSEILANMSVESFSALPLVPFLKRVASGEEPPFVKTEEPPEEAAQPGRPLKIVGTTFAEQVDDESVDTVIAMFAGEKGPGEVVAKVAYIFRSLPSLRVATFNVSANAFNATRYHYTGGGKGDEQFFLASASTAGKLSPLVYEARSVEEVGVSEWVLKHAASLGTAPAEALGEAKKMVKKMRKQKDKEASEMFGGMDLGGGDKPKKKKKKKRKAGKPKDEL